MKNSTIIIFSIFLYFSIQGCNQSVINQQANALTIEKEETDAKNVLITEDGKWYENAKDTTINIGNKQIYEKIEIVNIQGKFLERKGFGDNGKEHIYKVPDTEINIQISNHQYKLQKQDIPSLDSEFLKNSLFQQIDFQSITEEASTFEITFGEPDTDIIVFIFLTIDSTGNKSFKIKYPEWDEE